MFALDDARHLLAELEIPPLFTRDKDTMPTALLVREVLDHEHGAYRTGRRTVPVATI